MNKLTVIIAPKPSVADDIASALEFPLNTYSRENRSKGYFKNKNIIISWDFEYFNIYGDKDSFKEENPNYFGIDEWKPNQHQISIVTNLIKETNKAIFIVGSKTDIERINKSCSRNLETSKNIKFCEITYLWADHLRKKLLEII